MNLQHPLPESVVSAFHMMWGNFPENVTLVHKSKEIIAVNKAGAKLGICKPGIKCSSIGGTGAHKGCLAHKALAAHEPVHVYMPMSDGYSVGFWIPLDEHPDYFLHFSVGLSINYRTGEARDSASELQRLRELTL